MFGEDALRLREQPFAFRAVGGLTMHQLVDSCFPFCRRSLLLRVPYVETAGTQPEVEIVGRIVEVDSAPK